MTPTANKLPIDPVFPSFFATNLEGPPSPRFASSEFDLLCEPAERAASRKRILLVDDDDNIRGLTRTLLEEDGYEVFACRNGLRALKMFRARGDIDLLLTDLEMPMMSGDELSERVTAIQPELPVVIVSGSVISEELLGRIRAIGWDFLAKPCRVSELLAVIAHRLAGGPRAAVAA